MTIVSQDTGQNLSVNESVGARFNLPLALSRTDTRRFGLSGGVDAKHFGLESFNTNNFIITTVVTNAQGSQTIESRVSSPQPARKNNVNYLPLVVALDFAKTDPTGTTTANLVLSGNLTDDANGFRQLSYSPNTDSLYAKLNLSFTRDQKLGGNWSLLGRAAGQVATGPLLGIEQFSIGGLNSVRGYYEGDEFGDHGWFGGLELRSPFITERVPIGSDYAPVWLRGTAFVDAGQRFLIDPSPTANTAETLLGIGSHSAHHTLTEINITPLLDLAFVLLVIFIITTPQLVNHLEMTLPSGQPPPPPAQDAPKPEVNKILINSQGTLFFNGSPVTLGDLKNTLEAHKQSNPELALVVNGSDEADYQNMIDVLDLLRQLDIVRVGLATDSVPGP